MSSVQKRVIAPSVMLVTFLLPSTRAQAGAINSSPASTATSCDVRADPLSYSKASSCTTAERNRVLDQCYMVLSKNTSTCSWQSCKGMSVVGKLPTYNSANKTVNEYGITTTVAMPPSSVNSDGTIKPMDPNLWPQSYLTVREALCLRKHFCSNTAKGNFDKFRSSLCALESDKFPLNPYLGCASITEPDCSSLASTLSPSGVLPNPAPLTAEMMVEQFYRGIFLGGSDASGKAFWIDVMKNRGTCIGAAWEFAKNAKGSDMLVYGKTPSDIVTGWYRGYLNRDPDTAGYNYWVNQVSISTNLSVTKGYFLESPDFRRRCDSVCQPTTFGTYSVLTADLRYFSSSCGFKHVLRFTGGGLTIFNPEGSTAWSTGNLGAVNAVFQGDGNFVLYNAAKAAVWSSNTGGSSATRLVFREGGRLSVEKADGTEAAVIYEGNRRTK